MVKKVDDINIQTSTPQDRRIAWWFENTLIRVIIRVFNKATMSIRQVLSFSLTDFIEDFEKDMIDFVRPLGEQVLSMPNLPQWVRHPVQKALSGESQAGIAIVTALGIIIIGVIKMGATEPVGKMLQYQFNKVLRPYLFDPPLLIELWRRGTIDDDQLRLYLAYNGVSSEGINALKKIAKPLYDDSTLTQLWFRETVNRTFVENELRHRGYDDIGINHWFEVRKSIPSTSDLLSIAVREGFNDDVAARFGYDENYPAIAADYAKQQGMQEKFFRALWRAHWQLPGLQQVKEMRNRGIISDDDVLTYLRAADIPIFWRNAILKWLDSIVTRVDARRMYEMGIWDEKRIYEHYKELGYGEQDAQDMTVWTSLEYMADSRELTKTDILKMYRDGILNENEATDYLLSLDYKPQAISLLLAYQLLKRDEQYERTIINNVKKLYINGLYDRTDVFEQMGKLDTPSDVVYQSLEVWDLERELAVKIPSITQLRDMVLGGVISLNQFIEQMKNKKYNDKYINWYIALWGLE